MFGYSWKKLLGAAAFVVVIVILVVPLAIKGLAALKAKAGAATLPPV